MPARLFTRVRGLAALATVSLLIAACGGTSTGAQANSSKSTASANGSNRVRIAIYKGSIWSMPVLMAKELGYFSKNNVDAQLVPVKDGPSALAAMASGSIDVLSLEPPISLPAIAKGIKMKVVAGAMTMPWQIVISNQFPGPKTFPQALKNMTGKKFGVISRGSNSEDILRAIAKNAGASLNDVTIAAVGNGPPAAAAIDTGQVSAVITAPPIGSLVKAQGKGHVLMDFTSNPQALPNGLGTTPDQGQWASDIFIKKHPQLLNRFRKSLAQVTVWMKNPKNQSKVASFFKKTFNNPELNSQIDSLVKRMVPKYTVAYSAKDLEAWLKFDLKWGLLKKTMQVSSLVAPGTPSNNAAVQKLASS